MGITLTNNAHTTLSADATSTDTIFYVEDIDSFPTLDVGDYFYCTIERTSGAMEIVKVTQINSSSFIVERGQENTIPISFPIGSLVSLKMTVQNITDLILTGSNINDDAYDSSWNGDTNDAPSRNAVYDKFVAVDAALAGYTAADVLAKLLTVDGTGSGLDADLLDGLSSAAYAQLSGAAFTGGISGTTASFSGASAFTSGSLTVGFNKLAGDSALTLASDANLGNSTSIIWTADSVTKWYLRHSGSNGSIFLRNNTLGTSAVSFAAADNAATFTGTITVPDDAYAAGWNGNLTVPTKNAVYDKIQTIIGLSDGDKGDVTVSGSGTTWTIDNSTITLAKMANINQYELIGRSSASAGVPQVVATSANVYTLLGSANYAAFRSSLGLGTAALVDTGTSGTKVALTDGANIWSVKNTFTGAGSSSPRSSGTDAAFEVLNAAATQNYYFGIKDSDSNTLYIGRGHSAAQGITPAIKISSADAVTMTGLTTGAGGIDIIGGAVNNVNGLHLFFSSNVSRIYSLQNGIAWRDMYIDGATTYLNANSQGRMVVAGGPTSTPSAGAHNNAFQLSNTDVNYGLLLGSLSSGTGFIQAQRVDATATTYNLSLQPNGGTVITGAGITAGGVVNMKAYTVAGLPAGTAGDVAYTSNGRKNGEGAGSGTGVIVFKDGTAWRAVDTGATVAA